MTDLDIESDAFLSLLTDALRSGPGSPAWHEALQKLRAGGIKDADDYRLLVKAREHLESGKDYRTIRAGPGFARKLMSAIDEDEARGPQRPPTSAAVAIVSAAVMLIVLLVIGYLLWTAAEYRSGDGNVRLMANVVTAPEFNEVPSDAHFVGTLQPEFFRGSLRLIPSNNPKAAPASNAPGGGIFWNEPIATGEAFSISVTVRVRRIEENLIAQVIVSDNPEFSPENGTTPHELVWLLEGRQVRVISPNGRVESPAMIPADYRGFMPLQITVDRDQAMIDLDGKRLWSGSSGLAADKPRYIGLRFLRRAEDAGDGVVFQSFRINTRQK